MQKKSTLQREEGYILITTMLIMLVLTIIGIAANRNTSIELQIAANDKVHKKTFYAAEAGGILGAELVEQNLNCPIGFSSVNATDKPLEGTIRVHNIIYGRQQPPDLRSPPETVCGIVGNDNVDKFDVSFYDADIQIADPETRLFIWGRTEIAPGGSLIQAAGYEGKGKSAAGGGVSILFDIFSQHLGLSNSESIIQFGWRHLVGDEGTCNY